MAKKITKTQAKKAAKAAKKHPVAAIIIVAVLLVVVIAGIVLYLVKPDLYHKHLGVGKHTYSEWVKTEPTCTADGKLTHYCTVCGEEEVETIPKLPGEGEHTYTEWVVDKENDCGNAGKKSRHCTVCGEEETQTIPATGNHEFTEWVVDKQNDCGNAGKKSHYCTVCGYKQNQTIPATGQHSMGADNICTVCGYDPNTPQPPQPVEATEFSIHFLEIGKYTGDCILIDCGETEVLIDAGSRKDSAPIIKEYLDDYVDGDLDYVISTHSDQDHIAALMGSKKTGIAYQYNIGTFIKFDKAGTDGNGKNLVDSSGDKTLYGEYVEMLDDLKAKGTTVYTASQCYEEKDGAQRQYYLDEAQTVSINILYNYYYYNSSSDENNYSVVTLLTQELEDGNKHYLFTGDLEKSGETKMVDYYKNSSNSKSEFDILPKVELYKAGHHGSGTSSTAKLLEIIQPKNVVVCCCCGAPEYTKTNANTFPTQAMLDNVGKYTDKIYVTTLGTGLPDKDADGNYTGRSYGGCTSLNGNVRFFIKGDELELKCSNNNTILKETAWFKENRTWNGV